MRYSYQREVIKKIIQETNYHPPADWIFKQTKKTPTMGVFFVFLKGSSTAIQEFLDRLGVYL